MLLGMRIVLCLPTLFLILSPAALRAADDPFAAEVFAKNCASCHQSEAGASGRIPQVAVLRTMSSVAIQKTLESGIMKAQAAPLSADERLKVATFLGITTTQEKRREELTNPCPAGVGWKGNSAFGSWGGDCPIRVFNPTVPRAFAPRMCRG